VVGNVWEWVADWYRPDYYAQSPARNPMGPKDSLDPEEPGVKKRVQRGGSFLCADNYCQRYDVGARDKGAPDSGAEHIGFRCVKSR
jgi:formylglycine-generating enzyme required for sulfatase activity